MSSDLLSAALLQQFQQVRPMQDPRRALAARLMTTQPPAAPIASQGAGLAYALTQGINGLVGGMMNEEARQDERLAQKQAMGSILDRDREQNEAADAYFARRPGAAAGAAPAAAPQAPAPDAMPADGATVPLRGPDLLGGQEDDAQFQRRYQGGQPPRGIRNNNPLNIEAGPFTQRLPGFQGSDGRFARFETPDQGLAAADTLLQSYAQRGLNTPLAIISRWAPAGDGSNNPQRYAAFVAQRLGVAPDAPLDMNNPEVRRNLALAMGEFENGRPVTGGASPIVRASAPAPGAAPAAMPASGPNPETLAWLQEGLSSRNPAIRQAAQAQLQVLQLQQRDNRVTTAAPGSALIGPNGQVVGNVPPAPSENERMLNRWRELTARGDAVTPEEAQERDGIARRVFSGQGTTINNVSDRGLAGETSQLAARRLDEGRAAASAAVPALEAAERIQDLINRGVITGTGADFRLSLERALRTAGLVDGRRVPNTEQLMAELASNTLQAAGGLSGPTSDRDILFLREVVAGNIALDAETIGRVTRVAAERSERAINSYNRLADAFGRTEGVNPFVREVYAPVQRPQRQQPAPDDARPAATPGGGWGIRPLGATR